MHQKHILVKMTPPPWTLIYSLDRINFLGRYFHIWLLGPKLCSSVFAIVDFWMVLEAHHCRGPSNEYSCQVHVQFDHRIWRILKQEYFTENDKDKKWQQ